MINLIQNGFYKLVETKSNVKILYIDNDTFAWVEPKTIGEILVASHNMHKTDCILAMGHYRLYEVNDEAHLSDQLHLELEVGRGVWQGYLLLTGLPTGEKKRGRIIPTHEIITGSTRHEEFKHSLVSADR